MRGIRRVLRPAMVLIVSLVASLLTWGTPATAGFIPEAILFSVYDGEWSNWVSLLDFNEIDLENASAVIIGLPTPVAPTPDCFDFTQPTGSQRQFSYSVDATECITAGEVRAADTLPLAWFIWFPVLNGQVYANNPCWDLRGTTSTEGDYGTRIRFSETLFVDSMTTASVSDFIASIVAQINRVGVESASYATHDRLRGIPFVPFVLEIESIDAPPGGGFDPQDLAWTIGVSIRRCGTGSDDVLLEHYRQQAALMDESALPNTR